MISMDQEGLHFGINHFAAGIVLWMSVFLLNCRQRGDLSGFGQVRALDRAHYWNNYSSSTTWIFTEFRMKRTITCCCFFKIVAEYLISTLGFHQHSRFKINKWTNVQFISMASYHLAELCWCCRTFAHTHTEFPQQWWMWQGEPVLN